MSWSDFADGLSWDEIAALVFVVVFFLAAMRLAYLYRHQRGGSGGGNGGGGHDGIGDGGNGNGD
jgi:hypothetical protein